MPCNLSPSPDRHQHPTSTSTATSKVAFNEHLITNSNNDNSNSSAVPVPMVRKSHSTNTISTSTGPISKPISSALSASVPGGSSSDSSSGSSTLARQWGSPKKVQLNRESDRGLGISIVGGKVDLFSLSSSRSISGIFVKSILPDSPAGLAGTIRRGDRILQVGVIDLREATHEEAVSAIRKADNPIVFTIQSLLSLV